MKGGAGGVGGGRFFLSPECVARMPQRVVTTGVCLLNLSQRGVVTPQDNIHGDIDNIKSY